MSSLLALSSTSYGLRHQVDQLIQDRRNIQQVFLRIVGDDYTRRCPRCNYLFKLEDAFTETEGGAKSLACPTCRFTPDLNDEKSPSFIPESGFTHTASFLAEDEGKAYQFMQLAANFISRMIVAAPMVGLMPANMPAASMQPQMPPTEKKWWYIVVGGLTVAAVVLSLIASGWTVPTYTQVIVNGTSTFVPMSQPLWSAKDATTIATLGLVIGVVGLIVGPDFLQRIPSLKTEPSQAESWSDWIQLKVGNGQNKKTRERGCMRKYAGAIRVMRRIRDPALREEVRLQFRPEFDAAFAQVMNKFDEAFRLTIAQLDAAIVAVGQPAARGRSQASAPREAEAS